MEKKKIAIAVLIGFILLLAGGSFWFLWEKDKEIQQEPYPETQVSPETGGSQPRNIDQSKIRGQDTEKRTDMETEDYQPAVLFQIDSLLGFLTDSQIKELQNKMRHLLPDIDEDVLCVVKCMTYQEVSTEDMKVSFYLYDSFGHVYEGNYSFRTSVLEVTKSSKTKEEIEKTELQIQAESAAAEIKAQAEAVKHLESERAAESEKAAESERIEKEKKKQEKEAKRKKKKKKRKQKQEKTEEAEITKP